MAPLRHCNEKMSPHLSVVVTSRNDNHGGQLLYRMQHFVNGLMEQCHRHKLTAELIIVEWNPPDENPLLAKALQFSKQNSYCSIRIIKVPNEIHREFQNSEKIPLYQMIGKNVGIRRALGKFVLATNIDILFSDQLIKYIKKKLKSGHFYRVDRLDVPSELPKTDSFDEILEFCSKNVLRTYTRFGDKFPSKKKPKGKLVKTLLDGSFFSKNILSSIKNRFIDFVRILNKWVLLNPSCKIKSLLNRFLLSKNRFIGFSRFLNKLVPPNPSYKIKALLNKLILSKNRFFSINNKFIWFSQVLNKRILCKPSYTIFRIPICKFLLKSLSKKSFPLNTNGCGDFTLLSAADWANLKGYPEWPIFSWHLDGVLIYQADQHGLKEVDLSKVIYHIDHGGGYSPEGYQELFRRLDSKGVPYINNSSLKQIWSEMKNSREKVVYNDENWGMADRPLKEITI